MTLNIELLRSLVRWARQEQDADLPAQLHGAEWDQSTYASQLRNGVCQTAMCIAGGAVLATGHQFVWTEAVSTHEDDGGEFRTASACVDPDTGDIFDIEYVAADVLGITPEDADWLFFAGNDLIHVTSIADRLCREYGHPEGLGL